MKIKNTHIDLIFVGDTVLCPDNKVRTVCANNIKRTFMGITLFGDSYKCGTEPVKKVISLN